MSYEYFTASEFRCKCCDRNETHHQAIIRLDAARKAAGIPFIINSAYRCREHNREVGGSDTSSHLSGWAFDIHAESSYEKFNIVKGLMAAGFNRIGVGTNFVHADADPDKPPFVMWTY